MKPLLINGEWVATASAAENLNPSDLSDVIDLYAHAGIPETQAAIDAAAQAAPGWAGMPPQQRFDILNRAADELAARKQEIGTLLSREEGKTLREGLLEAEHDEARRTCNQHAHRRLDDRLGRCLLVGLEPAPEAWCESGVAPPPIGTLAFPPAFGEASRVRELLAKSREGGSPR